MYFANLLKRPFYHACIHHTYIYGQAHNMDIIQVRIDTMYFYWSFFPKHFSDASRVVRNYLLKYIKYH